LKDEYVPKIYSADGFRNKFFQIEAAMERTGGKEEFGAEDDFQIDTYEKGDVVIDIIHYNAN